MAANMLFRRVPGIRLFSNPLSVFRHGLARESTGPLSVPPNVDCIEKILQQRIEDLPVVDMTNPYVKERQVCILCKYQLELNYKNTKLLSQFVSPFTGRLYSKNITGLCRDQYERVSNCIEQAREFGFMPHVHKEIAYLKDPPLFTTSTSARKKR